MQARSLVSWLTLLYSQMPTFEIKWRLKPKIASCTTYWVVSICCFLPLTPMVANYLPRPWIAVDCALWYLCTRDFCFLPGFWLIAFWRHLFFFFFFFHVSHFSNPGVYFLRFPQPATNHSPGSCWHLRCPDRKMMSQKHKLFIWWLEPSWCTV